jgi:hypothetical protein
LPFKNDNNPNIPIIIDYLEQLSISGNIAESMFFQNLLDSLVYEIYFPDKFALHEKQIRKHLGELKPIPDCMQENERAYFVQNEYRRIQTSNDIIVRHIETIESIEEIKVIRESLRG